jgi:hypothetical protein
MKVTVAARGRELSHTEWNDIKKSPAYLRFRRNMLSLQFSTSPHGGKFHDEIYHAQKTVTDYLREHMTGLWHMEGGSGDSQRGLYLESARDAVNFRIRWHDTEVT